MKLIKDYKGFNIFLCDKEYFAENLEVKFSNTQLSEVMKSIVAYKSR